MHTFTCFLSFYLIFSIIFTPSHADGVLSCGGFVKSDVEINFSVVEVKLYTTQGSIKYQTDCAPNTGYYLIPLYDKGDFILKVEPPKGWSFEPESYELHIDGTTDKCSLQEDINFKFIGFSLTGKIISKGQVDGPAGVSLTLISSGTAEPLQQSTVTGESGSFSFSKVLPGEYDIKASHPTWKFEKADTHLTVSSDNGNVGANIVINGYDVKGRVYSEGEPIKGVNFILFSKLLSAQDISECDKTAVKGFSSSDTSGPLCHVTSKQDGSFVFPSLPTGEYHIVPFYKGEHITFDVIPLKLEFTVGHDSVNLEPSFTVAGFSVSGKVLDSAKGSGVAHATILLNGKEQTHTGENGEYNLENMKTGTYNLQVTAENIFFAEVDVKITPNTPQLPDIIASQFSLCGTVVIEKIPDGLNQVPTSRRVIVYPEGKGGDAVSIASNPAGAFCTKVQPGKYVVKVHISDAEVKAGLQLLPVEKIVSVTNRPVLDIIFSQLRAKISGSVTCMERCGQMEVSLDSVGRTESRQIVGVKDTPPKGASFMFENVLPGKYKVTLLQDSWCWQEKTLEVDVVDSDVSKLAFVHTGYILKCSLSHEIALHFAHEKKEGSVGSFQLNKGTNRFCLAEPGVYRLTPDSCHQFEKEVYTYDTSNPETLSLTAIKHLVKGKVTADKQAADILINIKSLVDKTLTTIGPLKCDQEPVAKATDGKKPQQTQPEGPFTYQFSHWVRSGEKLEVEAQSKVLLFSPSSMDVVLQGDSCPGEVATFIGREGTFMVGKISPPLPGVVVTVATQDNTMEPVSMETDENGSFRIGPLHRHLQYEVTAKKAGYLIVKEEGTAAMFKAYKLGEVSVKVLDEKDQPLSSVLLSLSGGRQYRSNNVTGENGTMVFSGLSPEQYFLRPMMKEYKFDPASRIIDVLEGTTMDISIKGYRVAFSCYGHVTSLNGEPEPGVIVEAVGQDSCSLYQEDSKTEQDGSYRIRGLEPKCTYEIRLKGGDSNQHIDRAAPKSRLLVVETSDFHAINIIAFRRMNQMDISGNIVGAQEHLPTIKITLLREDNPDSPIHTLTMGSTSFFYLPSLQIDQQSYVVKLESSLSRVSYDFSLPQVVFTANVSYKHFTLKFEPRRKSLDNELNQGSFLTLPLMLLAIFAAYNHEKLLPLATQVAQYVQVYVQGMINKQQTSEAAPPAELASADPLASKKKSKPRKT